MYYFFSYLSVRNIRIEKNYLKTILYIEIVGLKQIKFSYFFVINNMNIYCNEINEKKICEYYGENVFMCKLKLE